ncbi:hypothetical protein ACTHSL_08505 [Neisseria sp. P0008.S010]|uniref:hypothetical protein n=1 Tax=Neisseria sp. P0008.S010 TaxID=3436707 RepID=UPI003F805B82
MSLNPVYLWQPNRTAAKASAGIGRFAESVKGRLKTPHIMFSDGLPHGCRMKRFQHKR